MLDGSIDRCGCKIAESGREQLGIVKIVRSIELRKIVESSNGRSGSKSEKTEKL